jgi:septal ring factor EnvC (AmiA/AmiB activator)
MSIYFNALKCVMVMCRRRSQEADRTAKELEVTVSTGGQRHQQQLEIVQEQTTHALQQAQHQISQEAGVVKNLTVKNRELDHQIRELATERSALTKVVDDARSTIDKLKAELQHTRGQVNTLTEQLTHSYAARSEGAENAARCVYVCRYLYLYLYLCVCVCPPCLVSFLCSYDDRL